MRLRCPKCSTAYRVDDTLVTGTSPTFRCSRCAHVFVVETRSATQEEQQAEAVMDTSASEQVLEEPQIKRPPRARSRNRAAKRRAPSTDPIVQSSDAAVDKTNQPGNESTDVPTRGRAEGPRAERALGFDSDEDFFIFPKEDPVDDGTRMRSAGQLSVLPFVSLFAILLFAFSLVTMTYQVDPAPLESFIREIPWYGTAIFESKHFKSRMELESLASGFQSVLGQQEMVVISGKVLNRNPETVANVQIEAQLYDAAGKPLGKQIVYLGNALSSKNIQDMTPREIALLQSLKPQNAYRIEPNRAVPFTIVLPKPDRDVAAFSCRIVSAELPA